MTTFRDFVYFVYCGVLLKVEEAAILMTLKMEHGTVTVKLCMHEKILIPVNKLMVYLSDFFDHITHYQASCFLDI